MKGGEITDPVLDLRFRDCSSKYHQTMHAGVQSPIPRPISHVIGCWACDQTVMGKATTNYDDVIPPVLTLVPGLKGRN